MSISDPIWLSFSRVSVADKKRIGGKAYVLAQMFQAGLSVPDGGVLKQAPRDEQDWAEILAWWREIGCPPIAVRSSAVGEDSAEFSFAGQQKSFLNVRTEDALRIAVQKCYASILQENSVAYRARFGVAGEPSAQMNVVLQVMVDAAYAGVFFSQDPRDLSGGWLLEVIAGLGEELVSGHVDPERLSPEHLVPGSEKLINGWDASMTLGIARAGKAVQELLDFEIDMEWAIDQQKKLWLLQARPVTAAFDTLSDDRALNRELKRLEASHFSKTLWDAQTFSEWTGTPTPLTLSIWKRAFCPTGAFGQALHQLGYLGCETKQLSEHTSVLETVFGRAYVNLSRLEALFFGDTAYTMVGKPRPHLEFQWERVNFRRILAAPLAATRMLQVAWRLQTGRRPILEDSRQQLQTLIEHNHFPMDPKLYVNWDTSELLSHFKLELARFSEETLKSPLMLIMVGEATHQSLLLNLSRTLGKTEAEITLNRWMGLGISTVTSEMDQQFRAAAANPRIRASFLARFGHRGAGELDLSSPRWSELGNSAFPKFSAEQSTHPRASLAAELEALKGWSAATIRDEWELFQQVLVLREKFKNELMKSYAHLRWMALELGRRLGLGESVFWLTSHELNRAITRPQSLSVQTANRFIARRKAQSDSFKRISLPEVVSLAEIKGLLDPNNASTEGNFQGTGVSPGLFLGRVKIVRDPRLVDLESWPSDAILVAEATDPGWTPLFIKARGIIAERGGVLSHCAIVARELGIPAVTGIVNCLNQLREDEYVWIDGNHGSVRRASSGEGSSADDRDPIRGGGLRRERTGDDDRVVVRAEAEVGRS